MMRRRAFLATLAAALTPRLTWADVGSPVFLAAGKRDEDHFLHGLSAAGESLFRIPLPARGHAAAAHPTLAEAVAFARRPGTFALVIDCATGAVRHRLTPPDGMQFNGHGAYSGDGSLLMTSEVVAETSEGRIGLWDTARYTRLTDWPSHGIGPHEIRRLSDGRLAVANGGIRTDPVDRRKLNLPDMRPNLALLSEDGALLDRIDLPDLRQNSIRHLALSGDSIAFAMQWEGDPSEPVPQLGLWTPGSPPRLCPPPEAEAFAMQGYAGSVAATRDRILVTSPRGGALMLFDAKGRHIATHHRADLCGAASTQGTFTVTDGSGAVWTAEDRGLSPLSRADTRWDNHLVALG
ncbi:DUF1513 domain-containing protein [Rhodobacter calidifons]|uniref:DUF1513 domain-containing protein n=1 Tax=Rhodobacter calidifons TaxID=2715277 RepID=A0ABX0G6E4_9RHOB|nr:DUF1513 domain-containing protein [Rhodobacter calidifons]NHB76424.1 DUF1513 domain-containing protein [Rhodobacter calidifons]